MVNNSMPANPTEFTTPGRGRSGRMVLSLPHPLLNIFKSKARKEESKVVELLRRLGIREGQAVMDFGCGSGTYTIPAARIVGAQGRVYALDKDREALDELM